MRATLRVFVSRVNGYEYNSRRLFAGEMNAVHQSNRQPAREKGSIQATNFAVLGWGPSGTEFLQLAVEHTA